jgi:hypothetical protein
MDPISKPTLRYVPERQDRPVISTAAISIVACTIGAGMTWIYFSQQVPPAVRPQRNDPIPAATPIPVPVATPIPIPVATPIPQPGLTPTRLPRSGEIRTYTTMERVAPLQIQTSPGSNYLVRLYDASTGRIVLSVFIQGGRAERIDAPLGTYVLKYASGEAWYGYTHLFGPSAVYTKADELFSFTFDGDRYVGYTVTLYNVANGNLRTSRISADQF